MTPEERIEKTKELIVDRAKSWAAAIKAGNSIPLFEQSTLLIAVDVLLMAERDARTVARTSGSMT